MHDVVYRGLVVVYDPANSEQPSGSGRKVETIDEREQRNPVSRIFLRERTES